MATDKKMQPAEVLELRDRAEEVHLRDRDTGNVLLSIIHHLAHAHGYDVAEEDEKARKQAEEDEKARNDQAIAESDRVVAERTEVRREDAPITPTTMKGSK